MMTKLGLNGNETPPNSPFMLINYMGDGVVQVQPLWSFAGVTLADRCDACLIPRQVMLGVEVIICSPERSLGNRALGRYSSL